VHILSAPSKSHLLQTKQDMDLSSSAVRLTAIILLRIPPCARPPLKENGIIIVLILISELRKNIISKEPLKKGPACISVPNFNVLITFTMSSVSIPGPLVPTLINYIPSLGCYILRASLICMIEYSSLVSAYCRCLLSSNDSIERSKD
jgi:hypothetical protein